MLTSDQLAAINRHLREENWLFNEDLIAELSDHYATGIEDRLAKGMIFDMALQEIYEDFGERKGLLVMEEEFTTNQYRNSRHMFKQAMIGYFKMPKLVYTLLLTGMISYLWMENPIWQYAKYARLYAGGFLIAHLILVFIYYVTQAKQTKTSRQIKYRAGAIFQSFNLIAWVGIWPQFFIPPTLQPQTNPILCVLLILATVLYEASVIAYFRMQTFKLAKSH